MEQAFTLESKSRMNTFPVSRRPGREAWRGKR
jgi:hypothetical protein